MRSHLLDNMSTEYASNLGNILITYVAKTSVNYLDAFRKVIKKTILLEYISSATDQ